MSLPEPAITGRKLDGEQWAERVLILAPTGNDARLTARFLADAEIGTEIVGSIGVLCEKILQGCGTLLLAEETLAVETIGPLLDAIGQQPSWSDVPVVLITSGGETSQTRLRRLTTLAPVGNVTMLERPFRPDTLLSAVETALRARRKQYQVRDLLADVQRNEQKMQSILTSITDGFVAFDKEWRFSYMNPAYLRLVTPLYRAEKELLGQDMWEKFPDVRGTFVEENYRRAMAEQKPRSFEVYYAPIARWLEVHAYPSPEALSVYLRDVTEQKRQEEAVAALTRKVSAQAKTFDTALSNITDFAYIINRGGRFVYANRPMLDLWGLSLEQVIGKNFFELNYPEPLAAKLQREIDQVFAEKKIVRGETPYTNHQGQQGYHEYIFSPVFAADGSVEVLAGSTHVITERKRTETIGERRRLVLQLVAEDAPLEKIFEALLHMVELEAQMKVRASILIADGTGRLRHCAAPSLPEAYNRAVDGIVIGPNIGSCGSSAWSGKPTHAADIGTDPAWADYREIALSHQLRACWSTPILASTGEVLGTFAMYYPEPGEPSEEDRRLVATATNTAAVALERKRAERALRASEAQLRLVTDHATVYLVQIDREHRFKFANRGYAARFGLEPQEIVGRRLEEVVGPIAYAVIRPNADRALAGERVEFENEIVYATIPSRWMHTVCVPERSKDGQVVGFVAVINDVTLRKESEQELIRARDQALAASRAKDDFLAALSHELRTPLNPVLLIASEAANDPDLPLKIRDDFETIARNATLEARLIDDLLDLTRITHGKMSLDVRVLDVNTVLADAVETVASELNEKRLQLTVQLGAGDHHVVGDPARLQQIFWNVLKNAVKFTPQHGTIAVETIQDQDTRRLVVRVTDSGIGMSDDEVNRVFEAFSQGSHAEGGGSHRFGGLGLGLAISRKLVELHAGRIYASSAGKDQGSTFTIELPLAVVQPDQQSSAPPLAEGISHKQVRPDGRNKRILVVEDHVATRVSLTRLLSRRGYDVVFAGSVSEGLQRAAEGTFDLVVSDIGLPDGDGYGLMSELREKYQLQGIALSGYGMEQDIARGRAAGFTEHLIKPINVQALDRVLKGWENTLTAGV